MIAFGYYGGKYSHLDWLLPLLDVNGITNYCEPFGGSAAVILNRKPVHIETYNDLNGEVVHFFRMLRDQKEALIELLELTPFSREEYLEALDISHEVTDLERARRFYIRARQTMMGVGTMATPYRWAYCVATEGGTAVQRWLSGIPKLAEVADRLRQVQIEHLPALDCIARYDSSQTLFYVDPPYIMSARSGGTGYEHEMTEDDHVELAQCLRGCQGKVALSGYESPLYRELYSDWFVTSSIPKVAFSGARKGKAPIYRQEYLWTNYNPKTINNDCSDLPLFQTLEIIDDI